MAVREVTYKVCDKGRREHPATKSRNFLWFGRRYEIDVCDEHDEQLKNALREWTDVAIDLTQHLATPALASPVHRKEEPQQIGPRISGPERDWVFTDHALQRCDERRIEPDVARRIAQWPTWSTLSTRGPQYEERMSEDVMVVVMPADKRIITVAPRHREKLLRQA